MLLGARRIPEAWLKEELTRLYRFCRTLTRNDADAEDLAQETLLKAVRASRFPPVRHEVKPWLYTIARNTWYSELRKKRHRLEVLEGEAGMDSWSGPPAGWETFSLQVETLHRIHWDKALAQLSPEHREVLYLVDTEQLSYEEAARVLDVQTGTIKSRVSRARMALAKTLHQIIGKSKGEEEKQ